MKAIERARPETRAVMVQVTEGEPEARIWGSPRVFSTVRIQPRLIPAEAALAELAIRADRELGPTYKVKQVAIGSKRTLIATL